MQKFESGAVRSADVANLRHDLLNPIGFLEVAKVANCVNWHVLSHLQCINESMRNCMRFLETNDIMYLAYAALFSMAAIDNIELDDENIIIYDFVDGIAYFTEIPIEGWRRVAETYKEGADKYGEYNYLKGMPVSDLLNHAIDHLRCQIGGIGDEGTDLQHASWGFIAAIHSYKCRSELNRNLKPLKDYYQ